MLSPMRIAYNDAEEIGYEFDDSDEAIVEIFSLVDAIKSEKNRGRNVSRALALDLHRAAWELHACAIEEERS